MQSSQGPPVVDQEPFFLTRGVVLTPSDLITWDWPDHAKSAGLTTLALHGPSLGAAAGFVQTAAGQEFLESCREHGIEVEHEVHAVSDLLPRQLFERDANMFRMDEHGDRIAGSNLCVHSEAGIRIACQNAAAYARILRPTTGRYFLWIDDVQPTCRCPRCRVLSDSDQALILENSLLSALREVDARATLAHLAYSNTLEPPAQVKPEPGIFLEFAPIWRRYDEPLDRRDARAHHPLALSHGAHLDLLDANLELFGREGAQVLEYWLDASRFSQWRRDAIARLPWSKQVFLDDLHTYSGRGLRHVTSFAVWIDGDYVERFGAPPLQAYGAGLSGMRKR